MVAKKLRHHDSRILFRAIHRTCNPLMIKNYVSPALRHRGFVYLEDKSRQNSEEGLDAMHSHNYREVASVNKATRQKVRAVVSNAVKQNGSAHWYVEQIPC